MPDTVITVHGEHTAWFPAERATVTVQVSFDGPDRDAVFEAAIEAAAAVRATVVELHDPENGPVTWWAADSIRIWSQRPWNNKGQQLEPVQYAALQTTVKFSEFNRLASWIELVSSIPGADVLGIRWQLTELTSERVLREVRKKAVEEAAVKASSYAQAVGLSSVVATAIADTGMLGEGRSASNSGSEYELMSIGSADGGSRSGGSLEFTPEQIEVSASVDARFIAAN